MEDRAVENVEYTSDRVNVVRCKDCLCFHRDVHDRGDDSYCSSIDCEARDYDYCSRAIRRPKEGA